MISSRDPARVEDKTHYDHIPFLTGKTLTTILDRATDPN